MRKSIPFRAYLLRSGKMTYRVNGTWCEALGDVRGALLRRMAAELGLPILHIVFELPVIPDHKLLRRNLRFVFDQQKGVPPGWPKESAIEVRG